MYLHILHKKYIHTIYIRYYIYIFTSFIYVRESCSTRIGAVKIVHTYSRCYIYIHNYVNYLQIIPTKYIHTYYRFAPKLQNILLFYSPSVGIEGLW